MNKYAWLLGIMIALWATLPANGTSPKSVEALTGSGEPPWSIDEMVRDTNSTREGGAFYLETSVDSGCYAWTNCFDGRQISCWSQGVRCRYRWQAGSYVHCEGYSHSGAFYHNTQYCY